ncbi:hypothetical protein ACMA1I_06470 [Pontibacter sp. 13R65]|uniref:hypothetical protein n=1 Tax=Pontibacter sp. 13R65 TaxID=3127458 RepID=UPI00301BB636
MIRLKDRQLALTNKRITTSVNNLPIPNSQANDICSALTGISDLLIEYEKLVLVTSTRECSWPVAQQGFLQYCQRFNRSYTILECAATEIPSPGTAYFTLNDADLASLIAKTNMFGYKLGQDIGLLAFDDSPIKKLMNLTVVTTTLPSGSTSQQHPVNSCNNTFEIIRRASL